MKTRVPAHSLVHWMWVRSSPVDRWLQESLINGNYYILIFWTCAHRNDDLRDLYGVELYSLINKSYLLEVNLIVFIIVSPYLALSQG